jgi:hypothetical protein
MDRASLRNVIRRKLDNGDLPTKPPRDNIYSGYGSGATCDACGTRFGLARSSTS